MCQSKLCVKPACSSLHEPTSFHPIQGRFLLCVGSVSSSSTVRAGIKSACGVCMSVCVCARACVHACVCVWERERVCVCACVCVCVCACVCVCVCEWEREREETQRKWSFWRLPVLQYARVAWLCGHAWERESACVWAHARVILRMLKDWCREIVACTAGVCHNMPDYIIQLFVSIRLYFVLKDNKDICIWTGLTKLQSSKLSHK